MLNAANSHPSNWKPSVTHSLWIDPGMASLWSSPHVLPTRLPTIPTIPTRLPTTHGTHWVVASVHRKHDVCSSHPAQIHHTQPSPLVPHSRLLILLTKSTIPIHILQQPIPIHIISGPNTRLMVSVDNVGDDRILILSWERSTISRNWQPLPLSHSPPGSNSRRT